MAGNIKKFPATIRLYNNIQQYLLEQELNELKEVPTTEINKLKGAALMLKNIIDNGN